MNNNNKIVKKFSKYKIYDLLIFLIFIFALAFRMIASARLPYNAYESAIVQALFEENAGVQVLTSPIEAILIKITYFFFGSVKMGARIWPILAGSILVFIPYLFRKFIGRRLGFILSVVISFEPFLLANSIQIGSNIFSIFGLAVVMVGLPRKNKRILMAGILLILLSGRGLLPSLLIIGISRLLEDHLGERRLIGNLENHRNFKKHKSRYFVGLSILILLFLLGVIFRIDFASFLSSIVLLFPETFLSYFRYASVAGLPVVFTSYSPLVILLFGYFCFQNRKVKKDLILKLLAVVFTGMVWLLIVPGKNYLDLVWLSIPMLIGAGWAIKENFSHFSWKNNLNIIVIIIFVMLVSISTSFSQFIYQGKNNFSQTASLMNIITMLFFFLLGFIIFLFINDRKQYLAAAGMALIVLIFIIQAAFSFRVAGFTPDLSQELLLPGAIANTESAKELIKMRSITKKFANEKMTIALERGLSPQLEIELGDYRITHILGEVSGPIPYDILITNSETIGNTGSFIGQAFVADAYPKWVESPVLSLLDYDYWSWLIFRNSNLTTKTNILWYATENNNDAG